MILIISVTSVNTNIWGRTFPHGILGDDVKDMTKYGSKTYFSKFAFLEVQFDRPKRSAFQK